MQLSCPNCDARYAVAAENWPREPYDDANDGEITLKARKVRCSACQTVWLAIPESVAPQNPAHDGNDGDTIMAQPTPRRRKRLAGAVLVLVAGAAGLYGAVLTGHVKPGEYPLARMNLAGITLPDVGELAPEWMRAPSLRVPEVQLPEVRLPVVRLPATPPPPLALRSETARKSLADGGSAWEISGTLHNPTDAILPVPPIEIILLDAASKPVGNSLIRLETPSLPPGATLDFDTTSMNPPPGVTQVRLELKTTGLARR